MGQRVAVVGAGAIGGYLAARLAQAGRDVTLCVRTPVERIVVESGGETIEADLRIVTEPEALGPTDWMILTVKAQDVTGARSWLDAGLAHGAQIAVVQNGIDHGRVAEMLGTECLQACIYCSVERVGPGRIRHHHSGLLQVPAGAAGAAFSALMDGSVFRVEQVEDFRTTAWRKLLSNVIWNPVTALTLRRNTVFTNPLVQDLGRGLLDEAIAVGQADGAKLTEADRDALAQRIATSSGTHTGGSSMLYDRLAERPLEHAHITGAVVTRAERYGVPAPLNRAILALLEGASGMPLDGSA